jgi:hypothetical protein
MRTKGEIPPLEGYTSLPEAGGVLRVTRQRLYQMAVEELIFYTIRAIPGGGPRPAAYVVENVELLWFRRDQCAYCQALAAGERVLYCKHTDKVVPAAQATAWEAHLDALEREEAERLERARALQAGEPVPAGA